MQKRKTIIILNPVWEMRLLILKERLHVLKSLSLPHAGVLSSNQARWPLSARLSDRRRQASQVLHLLHHRETA